jgi:CBS domain-containing protein
MGSEGRGEQLLKTDQDNGLILRDGRARAHEVAAGVPALLGRAARLRLPDCPGGIMVSNPSGGRSGSDFGHRARWLLRPDPRA